MDREHVLEKPQGRANARYIKKNYPEEYEKIILIEGESFVEKLYKYFYESPTHKCIVCGKDTPFQDIKIGYKDYCSKDCFLKSPFRVEKAKKTCLEKYGVDNPSKSKEVQEKKVETCLKNHGVKCGLDKKELIKKTLMEKYGVDNPSKSKEVQEKKKETCLKNHGVMYGLDKKELIKKTLMEKYGVDNPSKSKEIQEKKKETWRKNFLNKYDFHIGFEESGEWICQCPHPECHKCEERTFSIPQQTLHDRMRNGSEICSKLMPIGESNQNTTLELFIQDILNHHNIQYNIHNREELNPKELDIYIPSKGIAIECNGLYWHSYPQKSSSYHINKYVKCKEKGIQLINIWEDWIKNKPEIVTSIIKSKLNIYDIKIGARKCYVKEVCNRDCRQFLNSNHIQGHSPSSIKLGLYYCEELVSVMTFSKSRLGIGKFEKDSWELVRFCNRLNTSVIGGASKLLNYFIKHYNPIKIVSYSSNDISDGGLYEKLGFMTMGAVSNAYWYVNMKTWMRYHRFNFRKTKLKEMGYDIDGKTETQIMNQLPYAKIFDSGTTRWEKCIKIV